MNYRLVDGLAKTQYGLKSMDTTINHGIRALSSEHDNGHFDVDLRIPAPLHRSADLVSRSHTRLGSECRNFLNDSSRLVLAQSSSILQLAVFVPVVSLQRCLGYSGGSQC